MRPPMQDHIRVHMHSNLVQPTGCHSAQSGGSACSVMLDDVHSYVILLQESQAGQTVSHVPVAPDDDDDDDDDAPVLIHFAPRE